MKPTFGVVLFVISFPSILGIDVAALYSSVTEGEGTYNDNYDGHLMRGACSLGLPIAANAVGMLAVAINPGQFDGSKTCGMCVEITGHGEGSGADPINGTRLAIVINKCPSCAFGDLELVESKDGRLEIEWTAVPCPVNGNLFYMFEGSHEWYQKLQIRNSEFPIESVAYKQNGQNKNLARTVDNFFQWGQKVDMPLEIVITDVFGNVFEDSIDRIGKNSEEIEASGNFGDGNQTTEASEKPSETPDTNEPVAAQTKLALRPAAVSTTQYKENKVTDDSPSSSCVPLWGQCGGNNYRGARNCCDIGAVVCTYVNDYYSACKPNYDASSSCLELNSQCGGVNWTGETCCQIGTCQKYNDWYYQCRI